MKAGNGLKGIWKEGQSGESAGKAFRKKNFKKVFAEAEKILTFALPNGTDALSIRKEKRKSSSGGIKIEPGRDARRKSSLRR